MIWKNMKRNKYPIYIISKGRSNYQRTAEALESMKADFHIVIEPQEYESYSENVNPDRLLVLPFSNLGQGSIPARNWVWEHSIERGAERHWILDDNIMVFLRMVHGIRAKVRTTAIFRAVEDFTDRYSNVMMSGMNYMGFVKENSGTPPISINTRIYSCILLNNDCKERWRGKYNEDTDLSLRILKNGDCTILFNSFLAEKNYTMRAKGGNHDELYNDGREEFVNSLVEQHPDVVKKTIKFGRVHHQVNYTPFKSNLLELKKDVEIPKEGANEYDMVLWNNELKRVTTIEEMRILTNR